MTRGFDRITPFALAVAGLLASLVFDQLHPGYFSDVKYLGALIGLQIILASLWHYDVVFFPLVLAFFLWSGMDIPLSTVGRTARWFVLAVAAFAGFVMWMREHRRTFGLFHLVALFCVVAAVTSAAVSADPSTSLLKALSLFLLFLYAATGARLAIWGREVQFIEGLLLTCEIAAYLSAVAYLLIGWQIFGNPNSLGAIMGVAVTPLLFWAVLVARTPAQRYRRLIALVLSGVLLYLSLARAGLLAAAIAVAALCICLRRQRLLVGGVFVIVVFVTTATLLYPAHFDLFVEAETSKILYKGKREQGLMGSRLTPWQETVAVIKTRPWFGSGFGTSYLGQFAKPRGVDFDPSLGGLSTKANREHGNSYLALLEYVGLLGILPFLVLVFLLARMVFQVCVWMRRTGNPYHCAIPFAMVVLAGLVHAIFEDWLTAVGYYLCVVFWACAFWLRDMMPAPITAPAREVSGPTHTRVVSPYGTIVPNR